jgi:amidase
MLWIVPRGSSSGSGAAVAANLCVAAIGTETDGSIISPSQTNGIVGIKPTLGLASRSGIIPIAHSQDTPGPMARTVADAAILLGALTGRCKSSSHQVQERALSNYAKYLDLMVSTVRVSVAKYGGSNPHHQDL